MSFEKFIIIVLAILLAIYQSSLGRFNFLWIVVIWLSFKQDWLMIFLVGLFYDLVLGGLLGTSSIKFLGVAAIIYIIKEFWPQKFDRQIKLKI